MRKLAFLISALIFSVLLSGICHAQSAVDNKAKAYFFAAQDAFDAKNYDAALSDLQNVQDLLGQSNVRVEALRSKAYYHKADYEAAKRSLDKFFAYNPPDALVRDMATYTRDIDTKLEAERTRILKARETKAANAEKARLLAKNKFTGMSFLSKNGSKGSNGSSGSAGRMGDMGRTFVNLGTNPYGRSGSGGIGGQGDDGDYGSSGKNGGNVYLTIKEETMKYGAPIGLVSVKNAKGETLSEGYWDFAVPLNINVAGGTGGNGGTGGTGGTGGAGASGSYKSGYYATAGNGGNGGNGGYGGEGGRGGNGGTATITLVGSTDFVTQIKPRINVNITGGAGGRGGDAGRAGNGGAPGIHANGTRAMSGNRGYSGKSGKTGSTGKQGTVSYKQVSLAEFEAEKNRRERIANEKVMAQKLLKERQANRLQQAKLKISEVGEQCSTLESCFQLSQKLLNEQKTTQESAIKILPKISANAELKKEYDTYLNKAKRLRQETRIISHKTCNLSVSEGEGWTKGCFIFAESIIDLTPRVFGSDKFELLAEFEALAGKTCDVGGDRIGDCLQEFAATTFSLNCYAGNLEGCKKAKGLIYNKPDKKSSLEAINKAACVLKDGSSCYSLSTLYKIKGNWTTKSLSYASQACEHQDALACYSIFQSMRYGTSGLKKNKSKAKEYLKQYCDLTGETSGYCK